jgi:hypothetical protein
VWDRAREQAIRALVDRLAGAPVQASLFDRRAIDEHDRLAASSRAAVERSERRLAALEAASSLRIGGVEPVLALIVNP